MSILIDDLFEELKSQNVEINGKWYIAKPYDFVGISCVWQRVIDAFRILNGTSRAYHFKEDEVK